MDRITDFEWTFLGISKTLISNVSSYISPQECTYQVFADKIKLKLRKNGKIQKSYGATTDWDTLAANFKEEVRYVRFSNSLLQKKTDIRKFVKPGAKLEGVDAPVMDTMGILKEIYKDVGSMVGNLTYPGRRKNQTRAHESNLRTKDGRTTW